MRGDVVRLRARGGLPGRVRDVRVLVRGREVRHLWRVGPGVVGGLVTPRSPRVEVFKVGTGSSEGLAVLAVRVARAWRPRSQVRRPLRAGDRVRTCEPGGEPLRELRLGERTPSGCRDLEVEEVRDAGCGRLLVAVEC